MKKARGVSRAFFILPCPSYLDNALEEALDTPRNMGLRETVWAVTLPSGLFAPKTATREPTVTSDFVPSVDLLNVVAWERMTMRLVPSGILTVRVLSSMDNTSPITCRLPAPPVRVLP